MKDSMMLCKCFQREESHLPKPKNQAFWKQGESATGYYLCIQTMTVSGPDGAPVSPEDCQDGRKCFSLKA